MKETLSGRSDSALRTVRAKREAEEAGKNSPRLDVSTASDNASQQTENIVKVSTGWKLCACAE